MLWTIWTQGDQNLGNIKMFGQIGQTTSHVIGIFLGDGPKYMESYLK